MISSEGSPRARTASQVKPSSINSRCRSSRVHAVLFHLFAFGQFQLIKISRHPAVGNMDQQKFRSRHPRKRFDVAEDGFVGTAVFKWNENVPIHVNNYS